MSEGELFVDVPSGKNANAYSPVVDWKKLDGKKGYRISVDARRTTDAGGTLQISFRDGGSFDSRYVVAINSQGSAMLRRFYNGENKEIEKGNFQLTDKPAHLVIEVVENKVTVFINGKEILNYRPGKLEGYEAGSTAYQYDAGCACCFR